MNLLRCVLILTLWLVWCVPSVVSAQAPDSSALDGNWSFPTPQIPHNPRAYTCLWTYQTVTIDGRLDDSAWTQAPWSEPFVDIEGDRRPAPPLRTRMKLLWDDHYFYIAAEMEEPHVCANLTDRDAVIYHDNDFEIFIDPDGDAHEYYELEVNAFNTVWDLLLTEPYRDDASAVDAWDITGLQTAVHVVGTINDPGDIDSGWTVEIAIPWTVLEECAHRPVPPQDLDTWWINFSRVEWRYAVHDGEYVKDTDPKTGKPYPENNWVWSPQGLIAMHYPEMWGLVEFDDPRHVNVGVVPSLTDAEVRTRSALWRVYYAQKEHFARYGVYTDKLSRLGLAKTPIPGVAWPPIIELGTGRYQALLQGHYTLPTLRVTEDGQMTHVARPRP